MEVERDLCSDDELSYQRSRTPFQPDAGMSLDDTYCLAHLPLINPGHSRALSSKQGTHYDMGQHPRVYSLVVPIPGNRMSSSPAYRAVEEELRGSSFSGKIAWHLLEQRQAKLHATLCGSLSIEHPPSIDADARRKLAALGPLTVELRGIFSGNVNCGRLYLRVYPERRSGTNVFHLIQHALRRPTTDLYVVGIWNLIDDLDPHEARALSELIERWWNRPILSLEVDHLCLLGSSDDLALDSSVEEVLPLIF
jgi:hypothetical protein